MDGNKIISNFIWKFAERFSARLVSLVVSIVLARILIPNDYGVVSLVSVFIAILDVFVNCGMGTALIQKKNADDLDFSTVFYFNIIWSTAIYLLLYLVSPLIAAFYENPAVTAYTRVAGVIILISAVKNVLHAYISKTMQFKLFFMATLFGTITSGVVGITMAYYGFGAWALITQNLVNAVIDTVILWFVVDWKPKKMFSTERLKSLFSFGWKLFVSNLLETVYNNLRSLIIGKVYTPTDLAYYDKGQSWPKIVIDNVNTSMDSVLLPALSAEQDDKTRVKLMMRKSVKMSCFVVWPLLVGLIAVAQPLVRLILTEKWLPSVLYLQLACGVYIFWPVHTSNLNAIQAIGRSDVFLKLEIVKKIIGISVLVATVPMGVEAIAWGFTLCAPIYAIINTFPNYKLLDYTIKEQISDMLPLAVLSGGMFIVTKIPMWIGLQIHDAWMILLQIFLGVVSYILLAAIMKHEAFMYLWGILKKAKQ